MTTNKDEISLKDFIAKGRLWMLYCLKYWLLIIIIVIAGGIAGYLYALSFEKRYNAKTSFVLSSDSRSGGLAGAASQLGLDLGGGRSDDLFSGDNIIALFRSRLMVQRAIFQNIDSTGESLINYYVKVTKLDKNLSGNSRLTPCYPFPKDPKNLTKTQDSLVRIIYAAIIKDNLLVEKPDKKTSLYEVQVNSQDEIFSFNLVNNIVNQTTSFYVETKTKLARENVAMLTHEADSLRELMTNTVLGNADATDKTFNLNPAYQVKRSPVTNGQTRLPIISAAYSEIERSLLQAKLSLQKETPLLQIIDRATLPLEVIRKSKRNYAMFGSLIAFALSLCSIILFKLLKNDINE